MNIRFFSHWFTNKCRYYDYDKGGYYSPLIYCFECDENDRPIREIGFATECGSNFYMSNLKPILNRCCENRIWAQEYLDMLRYRNDCETRYLMEQIQPTNQEN
jgi:hypothetical protein